MTQIPNPIVLGFHPNELNEPMKTLWQDDTARTLWLAWKCCHIVSQFFIFDCWNAAQRLKAITEPITENDLVAALLGPDFGNDDVRNWAAEAKKFFNGQQINWVVKSPQFTEQSNKQENQKQ